MVRGKSDYVKFVQDPDIRKIFDFDVEMEEEIKGFRGIQPNFVRGVNWMWLYSYYLFVGIDEKLVSFFKQHFYQVDVDDGNFIAMKELSNIIFYNQYCNHFL